MCAEAGAFVLAFEPDPTEFAALQANTQRCESVSVYRIALWNRAEELELFSSNETGDTSLIQPQRYSKTLKTTAMALDEFDDLPLAPKRIRLLKLEAEGAEPEILEGMEKTLPRVDYITADLGPERGAKNGNYSRTSN